MTEKLIATLKTEILHEEDTDQFNNNCIEMRKSQINLPNKIVICDSGQTQSTHRPQIQNDKRNTNLRVAAGRKKNCNGNDFKFVNRQMYFGWEFF